MATSIRMVLSMSMLALSMASSFRGSGPKSDFLAPLAEGADAEEVRASLQSALDAILATDSTKGDYNLRVQMINASMWPTFQSLPKASEDRLGHHSVRHLLRSYFAKAHGWTIFELNSHEPVSNTSSLTNVLQASVPAIMEAVLEAREHGKGLSLMEVVAIATAIERLIFDESVLLLQMAYTMNGYDMEGDLDEHMVNELLVSYVSLFGIKDKAAAEKTTPEGHHRWKMLRRSQGKLQWEGQFVSDSVRNFNFEMRSATSPFHSRFYNFDTVSQIVDRMAQGYGQWQDQACVVMRDALEARDVSGTGRIDLADFYGVGNLTFFVLNEPVERLRELGALDESVPSRPQVRIANYVLSEGNCVQNSNYYHVCCISPCDLIMTELEAKVMAPSASPETLITLLSNMSAVEDAELHITSSPLNGPSAQHLNQALQAIASKHGGLVPLHGRLFSKWMHFAFPRECPLPLKLQELSEAEPSTDVMKVVAPQEWSSDMEYHMPINDASWTEDEEVPLFADLKAPEQQYSQIRAYARLLAMLGAAAAMVNIGSAQLQIMRRAVCGVEGKAKKDDDFLLPMRF